MAQLTARWRKGQRRLEGGWQSPGIALLNPGDATAMGDATRLTLGEALYLAERFDQARRLADQHGGTGPAALGAGTGAGGRSGRPST